MELGVGAAKVFAGSGAVVALILTTAIPNPLSVVAVGAIVAGAAYHVKKEKLDWKYEDVINAMADKITNEFVAQHKYQIIYNTN